MWTSGLSQMRTWMRPLRFSISILAARVERAGLVDRRGRPRRGCGQAGEEGEGEQASVSWGFSGYIL